MDTVVAKHSNAEVSRLGREIFDRVVKPFLPQDTTGKYVVIDVNSEDYVIDNDGYTAITRMKDRRPDGDLWMMRADGTLPRIRGKFKWSAT